MGVVYIYITTHNIYYIFQIMKHIDLDHKYKINNICYDCLRECKQDYRVMVVKCPIRVSDMQNRPEKALKTLG